MDQYEQIIEGELARAVDTLMGGQAARMITAERARAVMEALAREVAITTRDQAHLALLSTTDMAAELGVSTRRVRALASRRRVGWQVERGVWVFRPEDTERLRPGPVGRPRTDTD